MTISNSARNIPHYVYDPPSVPSLFKHRNRTIQPKSNHNKNQRTSSQHYDSLNYSLFPPTNSNIQIHNYQNVPESNNNTNLMTQHPYTHLF